METFITLGILFVVAIGFYAWVFSFVVKKLRQHTGKIGRLSSSGSAQKEHQHMSQEHRRMTNPYINPGIDLVIDRHYHGIDNGVEPKQHHASDAFPHHNGSGGEFNNDH